MLEHVRRIGFSTGSLCGPDFRSATEALRNTGATAIELSALREAELDPLLRDLPGIALAQYDYVSLHAPSNIVKYTERELIQKLRRAVPRAYPIIVHADIIKSVKLWKQLGEQLCIENMDKRKETGRTAGEIRTLFQLLPKATFCLDVAHARQVDPSMSEAVSFLLEFRPRLRQVHISELNSASKHEALSFAGVSALQSVRDLIPHETAVILEFHAEPYEIEAHLRFVTGILDRVKPALRLEAG